MLNLATDAHRRLNLLTGEWVLVSPHRTTRPWQGQIEERAASDVPAYDPKCYMCPGNTRAGGQQNPPYTGTFAFTNDFPALVPDGPTGTHGDGDLLVAAGEAGLCRVLCFSPRHDLTLSLMDLRDIRAVVDLWAMEVEAMRRVPGIRYAQIFENRGAMMGASNPHPHGQIWATSSVPNEVVKEDTHQRAYHQRHAADLLGDYLALERRSRERIVYENEHFCALVPFWAVWPFETLVIPARHLQALEELRDEERDAFADVLKQVTTRYDNLFATACPYSMGIHHSPFQPEPQPWWRLHAHFYPPLLRSATIRKFMVGFEMLGGPQRDITPELAAARLREVG